MYKSELFDPELGMSYMGGDEEIYVEVLQMYIETSEEKLPLIETLYKEENWKNYIVEVHALKSTSLTIGAQILSEAAKELEFAGKGENYELIHEKTASVLELYKKVVNEGKKYLGLEVEEPSTESTCDLPEMDVTTLKSMVDQIVEECDAFDGDEVEKVCDELCKYAYQGTPLKNVFGAVKSDVKEFEFDRAAKKVADFVAGM